MLTLLGALRSAESPATSPSPVEKIDWADHIYPVSKGGLSTVENGICASWFQNIYYVNVCPALICVHYDAISRCFGVGEGSGFHLVKARICWICGVIT